MEEVNAFDGVSNARPVTAHGLEGEGAAYEFSSNYGLIWRYPDGYTIKFRIDKTHIAPPHNPTRHTHTLNTRHNTQTEHHQHEQPSTSTPNHRPHHLDPGRASRPSTHRTTMKPVNENTYYGAYSSCYA